MGFYSCTCNLRGVNVHKPCVDADPLISDLRIRLSLHSTDCTVPLITACAHVVGNTRAR